MSFLEESRFTQQSRPTATKIASMCIRVNRCDIYQDLGSKVRGRCNLVRIWRVGLEGDLNSHKKSDPDKDERSKQRHDARIDESMFDCE